MTERQFGDLVDNAGPHVRITHGVPDEVVTPGITSSHPLADAFPLVDGQPFAEMVEDIRENGLHEPESFDAMMDRIAEGAELHEVFPVDPTK